MKLAVSFSSLAFLRGTKKTKRMDAEVEVGVIFESKNEPDRYRWRMNVGVWEMGMFSRFWSEGHDVYGIKKNERQGGGWTLSSKDRDVLDEFSAFLEREAKKK